MLIMAEGHRERLKQRFLREGLDGFEPHNILELALFFVIPRRDTNALAHELINTFGSLSAVFDAPAHELMRVKGIGENAALYLKLFPSIFRLYEQDKRRKRECIDSTEDAGKHILPQFVGRTNETVYAVYMDNKRKVLYSGVLFEGNVNSAQISTRKIAETAIRFNASSVILAHNHPGGLALPSREDIGTTHKIASVLHGMGIELADHLIVADDDFVSMADSGFLADGALSWEFMQRPVKAERGLAQADKPAAGAPEGTDKR